MLYDFFFDPPPPNTIVFLFLKIAFVSKQTMPIKMTLPLMFPSHLLTTPLPLILPLSPFPNYPPTLLPSYLSFHSPPTFTPSLLSHPSNPPAPLPSHILSRPSHPTSSRSPPFPLTLALPSLSTYPFPPLSPPPTDPPPPAFQLPSLSLPLLLQSRCYN